MKIDCRIEDGSELAKFLESIHSQGRGKRSDYIRSALQFYYDYASVHEQMLQMLESIQQQQVQLMDRLQDIERRCPAPKSFENIAEPDVRASDDESEGGGMTFNNEEEWLDYLKTGLDDFK